MIVSALFMLTLFIMGQMQCAWSLQAVQQGSQNHSTKERAVIISTGAGISDLPVSEFPLSSSQGQKSARQGEHEHLLPLGSGHEDGAQTDKMTSGMLEMSAGASFTEPPSSELAMSSSPVRRMVRLREYENLTSLGRSSNDGAEAHKMTSASLEVSAGADFSELPISEIPISSAQGPKLVRRREHEHLTPLGSGPTDGAEPDKMPSASLQDSAGSGFSEVPVSELPTASSQALRFVRRVEHELLTPLGIGPKDAAEAHKVTFALPDFAKADDTSSSAIEILSRQLSVDRLGLHTFTIVFIAILGLAVIVLVVVLGVSLERAWRDNQQLRENTRSAPDESRQDNRPLRRSGPGGSNAFLGHAGSGTLVAQKNTKSHIGSGILVTQNQKRSKAAVTIQSSYREKMKIERMLDHTGPTEHF